MANIPSVVAAADGIAQRPSNVTDKDGGDLVTAASDATNESQDIVIRALPGGRNELSVNLRSLQPPIESFYANTARVDHFGGLMTISFGQLRALDAKLMNSWMSIELPLMAARELCRSVDGAFQETVERWAEEIGAPPEYPSDDVDPTLPGSVLPATLLRCSIAMNLASVDVYAIVPNPNVGGPEIWPVVRVDLYASVLKLVLDRCREIVREKI